MGKILWIGVKVLFARQMYGLKHRWIVDIVCLVYTVSWLVILVFANKDMHSINEPTFSETRTVPDPLELVVMPQNNYTKGLLTEAYRNLEYQFNSSLNVHIRFAESIENMNHVLETSIWPSMGLEFHKTAADGLEYTLHPVVSRRVTNFAQSPDHPLPRPNVEEFSDWLLRIRVAVDTAYLQKHFPDRAKLRIKSLTQVDMTSRAQREIMHLYIIVKFGLAHLLLSLSLLFIMSLLVSYIVKDRLSGVRELLCIYGLPRWMVNMSWLVFFGVVAIILAILQTVILKVEYPVAYITHLDLTLLAIFLVLNNWTSLVFVSVVANLITHKVATIVLVLLYWIITGMGGAALILFEFTKDRFALSALISLVPNIGAATFFGVLIPHEDAGNDISFGNAFTSTGQATSPGLVLIMMLLGILIHLALAVYLDFVKPGPYGRARPWYLYKGKDKMIESQQEESTEGVITEELKDQPIGLRCVNIVKFYGTHKALDNVNLSIAKNKITVLLGHNGAGKTTLFSILCGMFSPTSGDVYTDEYSVFQGNNITEFRKSLGYCPQENILLNDLTVEEHMIIFGLLKGWSKTKAREFSNKWTQMFGMDDRRNTQAKKLSGGTKRKLCLAIAMTGKPKFLLLDEPSAGMDIESTRKFRDVLLEDKGNCTVIITTHDMDEAEVLGDRIAILAHGQLKCLGSSSFLKSHLDSGYRLNCAVLNRNTQDVINAVNRIVRNTAILYRTNRSVTFSIPGKKVNIIPELLYTLESLFGGTVSSSLSLSTLDDVFVKVHQDLGVKVAVEKLPIIQEEEMRRSSWNFVELFMRRVKWILWRRLVVMIIMVIVLPCLGMVGSLVATYSILITSEAQPDNSQGFAVISNMSDAVSDILRSPLNSSITFAESTKDVKSTLIDLAHRNLFSQSELLFAFTQTDAPTVFFPKKADHSVHAAYSALINALLQGNATIVTHYSPHTTEFADPNFRCVDNPFFLKLLGIGPFSLIVGIFLLIASSYFLVFPHEERTSLFKHLLLMTGLLPEVYWLVNLIFDMLIYLCACTLLIIIALVLDYNLMAILEPVIGSLILALLLYGVSSILFAYIWSFVHKTVATPLVMLILCSLFVGIGFFAVRYYSGLTVKYDWSFFIPWSILWSCMYKIFVWAIQNMYCDRFKGECKNMGCDYVKSHTLFGEELRNEYLCFAGIIAAYWLFLMFLDHGLGRTLMGLILNVLCGKIKNPGDEVNDEVALEKKRVNDLVTVSREDQPEIVVDGLGKKYRKRTAVYDVTFTAERGECFGLVGVNGAGKSTTFKMLVALLRPTKGTAVIEGQWKVTGCTYQYLKRLGYCPQSDGIIKQLSARNILTLFGRVGGVPRDQIGPLVEKWLTALDMAGIADRPSGQYSGGNKRKLSLAISLIANPPVTLLDEPTAGVDPIVRRKMYEILTTSLEQTQKTIILTSHTMSECEAICDRLTIMVRGVMKCLGPIPLLKKTFGKSCILEVKFSTKSNARQQNFIKSKIESQFSGYISLKDTQPNRLVFTLQTEDQKIYDLFATMLRIKSENPVIEDFNLSESPLEEVFLMFAQK